MAGKELSRPGGEDPAGLGSGLNQHTVFAILGLVIGVADARVNQYPGWNGEEAGSEGISPWSDECDCQFNALHLD